MFVSLHVCVCTCVRACECVRARQRDRRGGRGHQRLPALLTLRGACDLSAACRLNSPLHLNPADQRGLHRCHLCSHSLRFNRGLPAVIRIYPMVWNVPIRDVAISESHGTMIGCGKMSVVKTNQDLDKSVVGVY